MSIRNLVSFKFNYLILCHMTDVFMCETIMRWQHVALQPSMVCAETGSAVSVDIEFKLSLSE